MIDFGFGCSLRRIREADLPRMLDWRNDYRIWQWCRQHDLVEPAQHVEWFKKQAMDPTVSMYAIEGENGAFVGVCGLTSIDNHNVRAEFSLYIGPEWQGRGLGKKALSTLLSHGFDNLGLHVIWGETFNGNPAEKTFKSLGFVKEGTRRQFYFRDGKFIDANLYSITSDEWGSYVA
jgi:[ribosomal protein S5]-alanine N-acetyltransferase